ncbi:MAG: hypothetical protein N2A97_00145, partial [Thermodesulfobacteriales bacterium]
PHDHIGRQHGQWPVKQLAPVRSNRCGKAPNEFLNIPSNRGTIADEVFGSHNDAVEIRIFTSGC